MTENGNGYLDILHLVDDMIMMANKTKRIIKEHDQRIDMVQLEAQVCCALEMLSMARSEVEVKEMDE